MVRARLLLSLLLSMPVVALAQTVEELLTRLGTLPDGQEQLGLLVRITRMRAQEHAFEEAIEFATMGADKARELDLSDQAVEFELVLAECADASGDADAGLAHALRAYSYTSESDKDPRARCALFLAQSYMRQNVPAKAQDFAQQAIATGSLSKQDLRSTLLLRARALLASHDDARALENLQELITSARQGADEQMLLVGLGLRAMLLERTNDIAGALRDEQERLVLATGQDRGIILNNIGELHARHNAHEQAHEYFGEAATWLAIDPDLYGRCLMNSAVSYARQRKFPMAEQTIDNAIQVIGGRGSGDHLADAMMVRAGIMLLSGHFNDAMVAARQALDETRRTQDRERELEAVDLLSRIALEKGALIEKQQYDMRAFNLRQELAVQEELGARIRNERENALHRQERDITTLAGSEQRERLRAREAILAAESQANEFGLLVAEKELQDSRFREGELARDRAQQELVLLQGALARERQDRELSQLHDQSTMQMLELNKLDLERKQKEQSMAMLKRQNELLEKDGELKAAQQERSEIIARSSFVAVGLLAAVAAFFFWVMRKVKGKNRLIHTQVKQIEVINTQLTDKNADLLSSINYAHNIQRVIIPTEDELRALLPDSFLYYRPRDIVSGDLPFVRKVGNRLFIATIDCTGHGVPAAMLSFMAYYNLNDIISTHKEFGVQDILYLLHQRIQAAVHDQTDGHAMSDGMDITLVELDMDGKTLWYSGAQNSLLYVRDGECHRIRGNKCSIGDPTGECSTGFRAHRLDLRASDRVYLYSDGLIHQFGGANGRKKFSNAQLMATVAALADRDAQDIGTVLKDAHRTWQGEEEQTDDIVLMGFSINQLVAAKAA